jgi:hypothetical protein
MLSKFRSYRPGHGTVIAYIALFIALGGTSYGLATGSVNSREIKNNTVRGKDIRRGAVAGSDVAANTLTGSDVSESTLGQVPSAGLLDGLDSTAFLRAGGKAADAATLDGVDSSAFVRGPLLASSGQEAGASLDPGAPSPIFSHTEFSNPAAGKFAVWATKTLTYTCNANGPCSADLGIYANNTPLEGSGRSFSDVVGGGQTQQLVMLGVTPVLPPGNVAIRIGESDSTGDASSTRHSPGRSLPSRSTTSRVLQVVRRTGGIGAFARKPTSCVRSLPPTNALQLSRQPLGGGARKLKLPNLGQRELTPRERVPYTSVAATRPAIRPPSTMESTMPTSASCSTTRATSTAIVKMTQSLVVTALPPFFDSSHQPPPAGHRWLCSPKSRGPCAGAQPVKD